MRPAEEIVLRALEVGIPVKLGAQVVQLSDAGDLCVPTVKMTFGPGGKTEMVLVEYPLTVGQFIRECRKLSQDDLFLLAANTALNEQHRARRPG